VIGGAAAAYSQALRAEASTQAGVKTAHDAASITDARTATWIPSPGSADADLLPELSRIVPRARDLARNSGIAGGFIRTSQDNIIGHQLRLNANPDYALLGRDKGWAREWSKATEAEFRTWAETTECDAGRQHTLWGHARLAVASAMTSGDHITLPLWLPRPDSRWATRLQSIESDRMSTPPQQQADPMVRNGKRVDQYGAPVTYYLQKNHPGDVYGLTTQFNRDEWEAVPAFTPWGRRRVIHLFDQERPGQSRGAPIFTKVLREFKVSSEYVGNEVHASAANAMIAAFLESDLDPATASELFGSDLSQQDESYWKSVGDKWNRKKMESGLVMQLPLGAKLSGFNPNRPNVAFGPFLEYVSRYIGAGLNIPYELLMKDFSKTNYSSARAALLEAWRYFLSYRRTFTDQYLSAVYALWMEEAVNTGRVEAPDFYANTYAYLRARWTFAGRGWVDPVKEAQAAKLRLETGLSTLEAECAEQGQDWEEVAEQRAVESDYYVTTLGLPDPYIPIGPAVPASTDQPEQDTANA
jgi:lambda family phage portal protein